MDATVILAALISGGVGVAVVALQTRTTRWQTRLNRADREAQEKQVRRAERLAIYLSLLDLLNDFTWDGAGPHVVSEFSKPFVRTSMKLRIQGSPATVAALDQIQTGLAKGNVAMSLRGAAKVSAEEESWGMIRAGMDEFVAAAREELGPQPEDGLRPATFRRGAGPPA